MITLAERVWRRDVVSGLEDWLSRMLSEAGGGWVRVSRREDGWLILEAEDERLASSILKLYTRLPIVAQSREPRTAKILELEEKILRYCYPSEEGSAALEAETARWAASLGSATSSPKVFLEAAGIVEGAAVSVSVGLPSLLQLSLLREALLRGLDRVLLIDLTPPEVEKLLQESGRLIAYHEPLTTLTHLLYIKLGVRLDKALETIRKRLERIAPGSTLRPLSWKTLARELE